MADGMGDTFTLAEVRHAVIVPPPPRLPTRRLLPLAVLDAEGAIVPGAECATNRLSSRDFVPAPEQLTTLDTLPGTWLYGGLASHHFGHQMTRSLGRLRGLVTAGKIDGILFAPLDSRARSDVSQNLMNRLFAGLGITSSLRQIGQPTRVDRLLIGPDLFSEQTRCVAHPDFVAWARSTVRPKSRPVPGSRLYVTRSNLDPRLGRLLCEDVLQQNLLRAGYQIYVPELHPISDQIETYAGAETIVTTDGSHGHVIAFARQPGQNIVTIARRFEAPNLLLNHLESFGHGLAHSQHHYLKCLTTEWWPRKRADNLSLGQCDFPALFDELVGCGALDATEKDGWQSPTQQQVETSKALGLASDDVLLSTEERTEFIRFLRQNRGPATPAVNRTVQSSNITYAEPKQMAVHTLREPATESLDQQFRPQGLRYFRFLKALHQRLRPDWYLEIGTFTGASLRFADGNFVAIDPAFQLHQIPPLKGREMIFFQDTSDAFFESTTAKAMTGKINLAFLDGLHHYEALLRDFTNVEPLMAPGGIVILHDCLPSNIPMADRVQPPNTAWTGDVWKTLLILKAERPDLQFDILDAAPTGLVMIRNMGAKPKHLKSRYKALIKTWDPVTFDTYPGGLDAYWDGLTVTPAGPFLDSLPQR